MAFDANLGHGRAGHFGIVRRVAGTTCRQLVSGMLRIDDLRIELIFMAGGAEFFLGLDEVHGLLATMSIVAKQTLVRSDTGMRLVDDLTVILMAGIAGFGLCLG
jgi:hypothetical protein